MADNPTVDNGTLTDYTVAADDDGTALHQYVKLEFGADNTQTKVSAANPLPVDGSGVTQPVSNAGLTELAGAINASAQMDVNIAASAITVPVSAASLPLPTGAATAANQTAIQYTEDAAAAADPVGGVNMLVRADTPATLVTTDGDNVAQRGTNYGAAYVQILDGANKASIDTAGADNESNTSNRLNVRSHISWYDGATWDRARGDSTDGLLVNLGANNDIIGQAAHDAAIAGNPVRVAGRALTADYTAVAAGDVADLITTLLGKLITVPYCLPGQMWSYAAPAGGLVNQTAVTIKAAAGAGIRNYITHIDVVNSHATISTELVINDGAAGTVLWRGWLQAAGGGYSINFDPPLRGTANTLLEIDEVTATGTTGVLFNCVGFTAAE